jgi:hypothetical protein
MIQSIPEAWAVMPFFKERIVRFCEEYDRETDGVYLANSFQGWFVSDNPKQLGLAVISDDRKLVGHVHCAVDSWCGKDYLTIVQFHMDEGVSDDIVDTGMGMINEYARMHYCDTIKILARNRAAERLFSSRYGFEYNRSILKKAVPMLQSKGEKPCT